MNITVGHPDDPIADLASKLAASKNAAGLHVIEAVVAAPRKLLPIAEECDVNQFCFDDDLEVLWLACDIGRWLTPPQLFNFCRSALQQEHCWDSQQPAGNYGMSRWSDATLDVLFGAMFASPQYVKYRAHQLVTIYNRLREARQCYLQAKRLLAGADGFPAPPKKFVESAKLARTRHTPIIIEVAA